VRRFFDNILLERRNRIIAWMVLSGILVLTIVTGLHSYFEVLHQKEKTDALFQHYFSLQASVQMLDKATTDSILINAQNECEKDLFNGWEDAASWLETIRNKAFASGINLNYRLGGLKRFPEGGDAVMILPVTLQAIPKDGRFEAIMQFIQTIVSVNSLSLEGVEFSGDGQKLLKCTFRVSGWIQPL